MQGAAEEEDPRSLLASRLREVADEYRREASSRDEDNNAVDARALTFLHLRDATIYWALAPMKMGFWRGRLSEVSGYTVGTHGE